MKYEEEDETESELMGWTKKRRRERSRFFISWGSGRSL